MSADNWTTCPRCAVIREERIRALDIDIAQAYGSAPIEEFDRLRTERDTLAQTQPKSTVREDYEFWGIEDGEFNASYRGRCTECGFEHVFKHRETLTIDPAPLAD